MARSLSNAKSLVSLVAENFSLAFQRRGYAAASQGVAGLTGNGKTGKAAEEGLGRSAENSWVPDPVTGYYRPANQVVEIDVAELREIVLKQKISSH